MNTLTRLMRDAAEHAPDHLDDPCAQHVEDAWQRGRRRRTLRAAATGAGTLAVLAVVASLVLGTSRVLPDRLVPADGGQRTGVAAYPQRIGHQWWVPGLGDKADPVSALVQVMDVESGEGEWQAVSARGERRRLQGGDNAGETFPAVSANGERIAYLQMPDNQWVIRDLRQGKSWFFPNIQRQSPDDRIPRAADAPHSLNVQSPAVFSPIGEFMAVPTLGGPIVLDTATASVREVDGIDQAIGWIDDDRLVGRAVEGSGAVEGDESVEVLVWSRSTGRVSALGRVELLGLPEPVQLNGQWWGSVRDDGTLWLSVSDDGSQSWLGGVSLPDLSPVALDGDPSSSLVWNEVDSSNFGMSWQGTRPAALAGGDAGEHVYPIAVNDSRERLVTLESSVGVHRVIWADDALNGSPSFSLVGMSTAWWTWWWKEIALVVLGGGLLVWWRRRRHTSVAE